MTVNWFNTILNHIDTKPILIGYEGLCMVHRLDDQKQKQKQNVKHPYPTCLRKCEVFPIDTHEWHKT